VPQRAPDRWTQRPWDGRRASGLLTGTAVGASRGSDASHSVQRRYDIAYEQCMYAKGNQLPPARTSYRYGS